MFQRKHDLPGEPMLKIYCEHNAYTEKIRALKRAGKIEILHFPYDPNSKSRRVSRAATPSGALIKDVGCTFEEAGDACFKDFVGSQYLEAILEIIGPSNRRDALHVDSAYKSGCACIVTRDSDISSKVERLESLLGLRIFHVGDPNLEAFLDAETEGSRR